MKIDDSRKRRMFIMEQISIRQRSRQEGRKSSAERRRIIQNNLNDFVKTMSHISHNKSRDSEGFDTSKKLQKYVIQSNRFINQRQNLKKQYDEILRSPSFKDIKLQENEQEKQINNSEEKGQKQMRVQQQSKEILNQVSKQRSQQNEYKDQVDQDINLRQKHENSCFQNEVNQQLRDQTSGNKNVQTKSVAKIDGNQSSASAIFFTSQFNEFINNKNSLQRPQTVTQQISIPNQQQQYPLFPLVNQKQVSFVQIQSNHQQKQEADDNSTTFRPQNLLQIHNTPNALRQNNLSDAIQQHEADQKENHQKENQILMKNKSAHSLAISNQSSLKYSLYQSNIKDLLNHKLTNQLVAQPHQFQFNQNQFLYQSIKLQILAQKYLAKQWKILQKDFKLFFKLYTFSKMVTNRQKRYYFQAFIINKEINFNQTKNQIKCNDYLSLKKQNVQRQILNFLKNQYLHLPELKIQKSYAFRQQKQKYIKQSIFRYLKISWFDQKVKKQVQLYYLSKLFHHFVNTIKHQKMVLRNKSLAFYCSNLKKKSFKLFCQGVNNLEKQRMQRDNANWHYAFKVQKKVFEAWKQKLSYKERYISLAMTTKNTFKQTSGNKWMQIKTVDFRQLKD